MLIWDRTLQNQKQYFQSLDPWIIWTTIFHHKQVLQQDQLPLLIMIWKVYNILDLKFGILYYLILETLETLRNLRGKLSVGLLQIVLVGYLLIPSVTLCISISHTFEISHSEVIWEIERVSILAGAFTMTAPALKCRCWLSFLCVFNYMFLKVQYKTNTCFTFVKFNVFAPISSHCTLSLPLKTSENINVIWCFEGVGEKCLGIGFKFKFLNQLRCNSSFHLIWNKSNNNNNDNNDNNNNDNNNNNNNNNAYIVVNIYSCTENDHIKQLQIIFLSYCKYKLLCELSLNYILLLL